ncbi:MAG TPA: hypothetical protein VGP82_03605, partial [Ktedonobacterales bacterium]|nr:hypothetical protein [Ktedonobacterales bacterium]
QETRPTDPQPRQHPEAASPGASREATGQDSDLDDWVWTGTDLIRRNQLPREDDPPTRGDK